MVAPFTGAWIEMIITNAASGLKSVAPFTGAWIEISPCWRAAGLPRVAPFTGAWIEILKFIVFALCVVGSLPSRERGLKCRLQRDERQHQLRRSLHGSVD